MSTCVYCGSRTSSPRQSTCFHSPHGKCKWGPDSPIRRYFCIYCGQQSSSPSGSTCWSSPHKKCEWNADLTPPNQPRTSPQNPSPPNERDTSSFSDSRDSFNQTQKNILISITTIGFLVGIYGSFTYKMTLGLALICVIIYTIIGSVIGFLCAFFYQFIILALIIFAGILLFNLYHKYINPSSNENTLTKTPRSQTEIKQNKQPTDPASKPKERSLQAAPDISKSDEERISNESRNARGNHNPLPGFGFTPTVRRHLNMVSDNPNSESDSLKPPKALEVRPKESKNEYNPPNSQIPNTNFSRNTFDTGKQASPITQQYIQADAKLNSAYKSALQRLDSDRQNSLRSEQRNWIKERDAAAAKNPSEAEFVMYIKTVARTRELEHYR